MNEWEGVGGGVNLPSACSSDFSSSQHLLMLINEKENVSMVWRCYERNVRKISILEQSKNLIIVHEDSTTFSFHRERPIRLRRPLEEFADRFSFARKSHLFDHYCIDFYESRIGIVDKLEH